MTAIHPARSLSSPREGRQPALRLTDKLRCVTDLQRVNLSKAAPAAYKSLLTLNRQVLDQAASADLTPLAIELLKIRISQLNGCAFCLQMHTREALQHGESPDRLAVLPAWRETTYFTPQERAALALSEAITTVGETHVPDETYAAAAVDLSEAQIAAVAWLSVVMNSLNRLAITSRYPVGPADA